MSLYAQSPVLDSDWSLSCWGTQSSLLWSFSKHDNERNITKRKITFCTASQSLVIGMCRLFQGPIHNSSSSDNVLSLWDSSVSLLSLWLSTEVSCSSLTHGTLLFLSIKALAILVLGPKLLRSAMAGPRDDRVFRLTSTLEETHVPVPFSVLFPVPSMLIIGGGSSWVTPNLSSFLKCLASRHGEPTFKLFGRGGRLVRMIVPFCAR